MSAPDRKNYSKGTKVVEEEWDADEKMMMKFLKVNAPNSVFYALHILMVDPTHGGLVLFDLGTGQMSHVMSNRTLRQIPVVAFTMSADLSYVLLKHESQSTGAAQQQHQLTHEYSIFSVKDERFYSLMKGTPLQYATWNSAGTDIIFVLENDIHFTHIDGGSSADQAVRLTFTGQTNTVYNGIPDYLYASNNQIFFPSRKRVKGFLKRSQFPEEIHLTPEHALIPSPNGTKVVFLAFNDSEVLETIYVRYGDIPSGASVGESPSLASFRFPTAGEMNPTVSVYVVQLPTADASKDWNLVDGRPSKITQLDVRDFGNPEEEEEDFYIIQVEWVTETELLIQKMSRTQKVTSYILCTLPSETSASCSEVAVKRTSVPSMPRPEERHTVSAGDDIFALAQVMDRDDGAYQHIVRRNRKNGKATPITFGKMDVREILAVDSAAGYAYFLASTRDAPETQHLFRVQNLEFFEDLVECVTCQHSDVSNCSFVSASLTATGKYFIKHCLGPRAPYSTSLSGDALESLMEELALPTNAVEAHGNFSCGPTLRSQLERIGGKSDPTERSVTTAMRMDLATFLSATRDVLTVAIDARGTKGRGRNFQDSFFGNIGNADVEDIIHVATHLSRTVSIIDGDNMVILGLGYGGYVATMALARASSPFACGAAVAPITTFSLYNSAFSERHLGYPLESKANQRRYLATDVSLQVEGLREKPFLLIHGSADETVPLRHSMLLSAALTDKAIPFRQVVYPDQPHELSGVLDHADDLLAEFFDECFQEWSIKREALKDD
ncbi:unnamed protein product [Notodromas monacha]|uniref:Uncharacterized protein n=1 Tax=Notodromas monacha TaxID=399045 RepID=A0A7R9GC12_9CRUS|nr:unnamed protein product [Notodromas monacha]CAG0916984.1 unnamed protein product [Notodromas monacha]